MTDNSFGDITRVNIPKLPHLARIPRGGATVGHKLFVDEESTGILLLLSLDGAPPRPAPAVTPLAGGGR